MKGLWLYCAVTLVVIYGTWTISDTQRDQRIEQAGPVLASLEEMHLAKVSTFVDTWRNTHKAPTPSDLTALRVDAERIKGNPSLADAYVTQLHELQAQQEKEHETSTITVNNLVHNWLAIAVIILLVVLVAGLHRYGRDRD